MSETSQIAALDAVIDAGSAAPAAEVPAAPTAIERRVYVGHKKHGTCITYKGHVFIAPASLKFDAKATPRLSFTLVDGTMVDGDGNVWTDGGENGACGPRLPASLKTLYGATWSSLSHAERKEIVKELAPIADKK